MTTPLLLDDLRRDEGLCLTAYPDPSSRLASACHVARIKPQDYDRLPDWRAFPADPWTIGYGHAGKDVLPGMVWTLDEAEATLGHDAAVAELELDKAAPWWRHLDPVRQDAVCELGFNLGVHKFTTLFPDTLSAIKSGSWSAAGHDLAHDKWARDVGPGRSGRIIHMLQFGARP